MSSVADAIINRLYDLQASNPEEAQKLIEQVQNPHVFDRLDIANSSLADKFRYKLAQAQAEIRLAQEDPDNNLNTMNVAGGFSGGLKSVGKLAARGIKSAAGMGLEEAKALLKSIPTDEAAVALKGKDRAAYLEALDTVYGNAEKRAKDMGFSDETWYHGTSRDLDEIDYLKRSGPTEEIGPGIYLASDIQDARGFGKNQLELKVKKNFAEFGHDEKMFKHLKKKGWGDEEILNWIDGGHINKGNMYGADEAQVNNFQRAQKDLSDKYSGLVSDFSRGAQLNVFDPSAIRSKFAAFDPRFKNSKKIMAGTAGGLLGGKMLADEMGLLDE